MSKSFRFRYAADTVAKAVARRIQRVRCRILGHRWHNCIGDYCCPRCGLILDY